MSEITPGEQFYAPRPHPWEDPGGDGPHVFRTVPFRTVEWEPGRAVISWDAPADYAVAHPTSGAIVHGGMVAMMLDTALAAAAMTVIDRDESFVTVDMRVEFIRSARQGLLLGDASVVRRSRQVVFCDAVLRDDEGTHVASARGLQLIRKRPVADGADG